MQVTYYVIKPGDTELKPLAIEAHSWEADHPRKIINGWIERGVGKLKNKNVDMYWDEEARMKKLPQNNLASQIAGRIILGPVLMLEPGKNIDHLVKNSGDDDVID